MHIYDSHTHLNDDKLFPNRKVHLQNFVDVGGKGLVNIGVDEDHNKQAIKIAREVMSEGLQCNVKATIGYHPSEVCYGNITQENIDEKMLALRKLYDENKEFIVGIGECGIDVHYPDGSEKIELQKELFRRQCEFAKELGLPIIIHSRDDFMSTLEVIEHYIDQKIYFHCYGYSAEEIMILREKFPHLRIGFCGNITYPKAQPLRDALLACDMNNIVFETDAPYLSPQKVRGEMNEPANVRYIYEFVAELLGKDLEEVGTIVQKNIDSLYRIS